jgi:hypothetical protein
MYENENMRHIENTPGMGGREQRRMMEYVNSAMMYCKNFCKCHDAFPVQQ